MATRLRDAEQTFMYNNRVTSITKMEMHARYGATKLDAGDALPEAAAYLPCNQHALASATHAHYTKAVRATQEP